MPREKCSAKASVSPYRVRALAALRLRRLHRRLRAAFRVGVALGLLQNALGLRSGGCLGLGAPAVGAAALLLLVIAVRLGGQLLLLRERFLRRLELRSLLVPRALVGQAAQAALDLLLAVGADLVLSLLVLRGHFLQLVVHAGELFVHLLCGRLVLINLGGLLFDLVRRELRRRLGRVQLLLKLLILGRLLAELCLELLVFGRLLFELRFHRLALLGALLLRGVLLLDRGLLVVFLLLQRLDLFGLLRIRLLGSLMRGLDLVELCLRLRAGAGDLLDRAVLVADLLLQLLELLCLALAGCFRFVDLLLLRRDIGNQLLVLLLGGLIRGLGLVELRLLLGDGVLRRVELRLGLVQLLLLGVELCSNNQGTGARERESRERRSTGGIATAKLAAPDCSSLLFCFSVSRLSVSSVLSLLSWLERSSSSVFSVAVFSSEDSRDLICASRLSAGRAVALVRRSCGRGDGGRAPSFFFMSLLASSALSCRCSTSRS